jgi:hypothetical protein
MRAAMESEAATMRSMSVLTKRGVMKFDLGSGVGSGRPVSADVSGDGEHRGQLQRLQRQVTSVVVIISSSRIIICSDRCLLVTYR